MMSPSLIDRVASCLAPYRGATGIVAVSGGPDSIALARAVVSVSRDAIGDVVLAHLNHQLRGAESDADEKFVQDFADRLAAGGARVRACTRRFDVAAEARAAGENLESCARRLRYAWFSELARANAAAWVATGHTADDQAETVLHRLLRGAGLHGLSGIAFIRALTPEVALLRPLLQVSRAEVLDFLDELKQPYCRDSSNDNLELTRNRLRHELLPRLAREYNPAIVSILCRLADHARQAQEVIAAEAAKLLQQAELPRAGAVIILNADLLASVSRHLVAEVGRLIWARECWPAGEMNFEDWERLAALAAAPTGTAHFPAGLRARRTGRVLQLGPAFAVGP